MSEHIVNTVKKRNIPPLLIMDIKSEELLYANQEGLDIIHYFAETADKTSEISILEVSREFAQFIKMLKTEAQVNKITKGLSIIYSYYVIRTMEIEGTLLVPHNFRTVLLVLIEKIAAFKGIDFNKVKESFELTPRELDILKLIALGLTNKEISEKLFISPETVKYHINHIVHKTKTHSRIGIISQCLRL